jgi:hypothetical protein
MTSTVRPQSGWSRPALALATLILATGPALADTHFKLQNHTGRSIVGVYASPSRSGEWGRKLNATPLANRTEQELRPASEECRQDVLVEFAGGVEEQRFKVDLCANPQITWGQPAPPADDPSFEFINGTGLPILELYIAPQGQIATAFDLLITGPLAPGARLWVTMPSGGGCLLDVALVLADQSRREWSPLESCSVRDVTFR